MAVMPSKALHSLALTILIASLVACEGKPSAVPISGENAMQSTDLSAGTGAVINPGQTAVVQYTGWLYEAGAPDHKGKQFDSSRTGGQPFRFSLGSGQVIKGWDQGVAGMKVGSSRRLVIPATLAYGDRGAGGVIPPGATLVFDIELIAIE
jgi:FKBP-type peptidyl-prolyl cis-trans isomerase FkpA